MAVTMTNFASSTLATDIISTDTSISVAPGTGAWYPAPVSPDFTMLCLVDSSGNREIVKMTSRSGDTLNITRSQEGTTARAFAAGSIVDVRATAAVYANKLDKDTGGTVAGATTFSAGLTTTTLTASGTVHTTGDLAVDGNSTLGASSGDNITFNAGTASIPNGLVFSGGHIQTSVAPASGNDVVNKTYADGAYEAADATLAALAGLSTSADQMIYSTGSDAFSMTALTAFVRTLLAAADAPTFVSLLGGIISSSNYAMPGHVEFANAVRISWASHSDSAGAGEISATLGWDTTLTHAPFASWASTGIATASGHADIMYQIVGSPTTTGCTVQRQDMAGGDDSIATTATVFGISVA
jgi:hypothetical protein